MSTAPPRRQSDASTSHDVTVGQHLDACHRRDRIERPRCGLGVDARARSTTRHCVAVDDVERLEHVEVIDPYVGCGTLDDSRDAVVRRGGSRRADPGTQYRPSCSNTTTASAHANPSARSEKTPAAASSSYIARSKPARTRSLSKRPASSARDAVAERDLVVVEVEVHGHRGSRGHAQQPLGDDVALDLRRARGDRQGQRAQALLDELVVVDVQRVAVEHPQAQLAEALRALRSTRASSPSHRRR